MFAAVFLCNTLSKARLETIIYAPLWRKYAAWLLQSVFVTDATGTSTQPFIALPHTCASGENLHISITSTPHAVILKGSVPSPRVTDSCGMTACGLVSNLL
ncbi:MAG: hypothetical protein WC716_15605 [Chitinophagaceae bacterium]|jgi:hypothetical protein